MVRFFTNKTDHEIEEIIDLELSIFDKNINTQNVVIEISNEHFVFQSFENFFKEHDITVLNVTQHLGFANNFQLYNFFIINTSE